MVVGLKAAMAVYSGINAILQVLVHTKGIALLARDYSNPGLVGDVLGSVTEHINWIQRQPLFSVVDPSVLHYSIYISGFVCDDQSSSESVVRFYSWLLNHSDSVYFSPFYQIFGTGRQDMSSNTVQFSISVKDSQFQSLFRSVRVYGYNERSFIDRGIAHLNNLSPLPEVLTFHVDDASAGQVSEEIIHFPVLIDSSSDAVDRISYQLYAIVVEPYDSLPSVLVKVDGIWFLIQDEFPRILSLQDFLANFRLYNRIKMLFYERVSSERFDYEPDLISWLDSESLPPNLSPLQIEVSRYYQFQHISRICDNIGKEYDKARHVAPVLRDVFSIGFEWRDIDK